jgi:MoxR-like ATPase
MSTRDQILRLKQRMGESIIGQEQVIERLQLTVLANGNLLLEGLPGLAKTRAVKSLARNLESEFRRIQFTPDLLPSDVTGSEVYYDEGGKGSFQFQPGPIFGNLVLADEINRAPAKVQAAILEAMEERQVTVAEAVERYMVALIAATRRPEQFGKDLQRWIHVGASPRGTLALDKVSRAHAWLDGRDHVTPDDVRAIVHDCLRHRVLLSYEANADGLSADDVINEVVKQVAVG